VGGCGTHSCTLCKYLLCVDEADEQDTDDDGPLMKPLVAPWRKRQKKGRNKRQKANGDISRVYRTGGGGEWQKVLHK